MSIKVVVDGSLEGLEIKKSLESDELKSMLNHSFVIRWGNCSNEENGRIVFNSPQSIRNTMNKKNMIMILRENHLRCPEIIQPGKMTKFPIIGRNYNHQNGTDIRIIDNIDECKLSGCDYFLQYINTSEEYLVHVMDLNVFYIEEKYHDSINRLDEPVIRNTAHGWKLKQADMTYKTEKEVKEIEELAVKAVYSLGLDFGVVNMARTSYGKYYVFDVDAVYRCMSEECKDLYIAQFTKTLMRYDRILDDRKDITIGADVECIIKDKDTGSMIFASDFFDMDGPAGFDNRSVEGGRKHFPILEIRPDYSSNPVEVAHSIQVILNNISESVCYNNTALYAGSMPVYNYWTGGHIHFGIRPNVKLLKAFDNYLALPLMMIEKVFSGRSRKTKFGELGNFRFKPHGFEYRTLSSWIINPQTARAVLCLAKVIAQEYLNLSEEFLSTFNDMNAYYSVNKAYFTGKIESAVHNIEGTVSYKMYKSYIEPLLSKVIAFEEWDEDKPINEAWHMTPNGGVFRYFEKCFIPKKKRKELGIELEEAVDIMIGTQKYKLRVYPKDDFSMGKTNYVSFTRDVCEDIGIMETESIMLWSDAQRNVLRAGPVLGIITDLQYNELGPFGRQSYYFKKLVKLAKYKGMIVYVFTVYDVEWEKDRIRGYIYDFEKDGWVISYFPIPDVIYDRSEFANWAKRGSYAVEYLNNVKKFNIKFINSMECIELTNNKRKIYQLLSTNKNTKVYLPQIFIFKYDGQIIECLERYGHIFIMLRNGNWSKEMISVKKIHGSNYRIIYKDRYGEDMRHKINGKRLIQIVNRIESELGCIKTDFIIQRAVSSAKNKGKCFEIRIFVQKKSKGTWQITLMGVRNYGEDTEYTNMLNKLYGGVITEFKNSIGMKMVQVKSQLINISNNIVSLFVQNGIQVGELVIDFVVDEDLNIFIIDLNSKCDNILSPIGSFNERNLAINRVLEYAKVLLCE